jgi:hypothetical protein
MALTRTHTQYHTDGHTAKMELLLCSYNYTRLFINTLIKYCLIICNHTTFFNYIICLLYMYNIFCSICFASDDGQ